MRDVKLKNNKFGLAISASLQIRNATISFGSGEVPNFPTNRDVGLVPALKVRGRAQWSNTLYLALDADGINAPISYLKRSDNEVVGAILDASVRGGVSLDPSVMAFLNLRYLGGGAVGTSEVDGPGDGYVKNWFFSGTVYLGFTYEWE